MNHRGLKCDNQKGYVGGWIYPEYSGAWLIPVVGFDSWQYGTVQYCTVQYSTVQSECSDYWNIWIYLWIFLTNNIHIHICNEKKLQIIFIFIFVVDLEYEYYSYSYLFRKKIIRYIPNSLIIVKTKNGGVFPWIFILISSKEIYRFFFDILCTIFRLVVAVTLGLIIFKYLNIFMIVLKNNILIHICYTRCQEWYSYSYSKNMYFANIIHISICSSKKIFATLWYSTVQYVNDGMWQGRSYFLAYNNFFTYIDTLKLQSEQLVQWNARTNKCKSVQRV